MIHPRTSRRSTASSGNTRSLITIAEIPKEEYVLKCTSACTGCSDSLALRYVLREFSRYVGGSGHYAGNISTL